MIVLNARDTRQQQQKKSTSTYTNAGPHKMVIIVFGCRGLFLNAVFKAFRILSKLSSFFSFGVQTMALLAQMFRCLAKKKFGKSRICIDVKWNSIKPILSGLIDKWSDHMKIAWFVARTLFKRLSSVIENSIMSSGQRMWTLKLFWAASRHTGFNLFRTRLWLPFLHTKLPFKPWLFFT